MIEILFIHSCEIAEPKRGTPIRMAAVLDQLRLNPDFKVTTYNATGKDFWNKFKELKNSPQKIFFGNTHQDIFILLASKFFLGKKIVIDLHSSREDEMYEGGVISKPKLVLIRYINALCFKFFDLVSLSAIKLADYYHISPRKWIMVYPGFTPAFYDSSAPNERGEQLILGYIGNPRPYQGLEALLEVVKRLKAEGLKFRFRVIASDQVGMEKVFDQILGDSSWVEKHYDIPHKEAVQKTGECDVLFILRPKSPVTMLSFPAKLPEYLATGKTSLISKISNVEDLLQDKVQAYLIDPDKREEQAYEVLKKIIQGDLPLLDSTRIKGFAYRNFTWPQTCKVLIERIKKI